MAIVYRHIRHDINKPFYIGIGRDEKRAYVKTKRNKEWNSIVSNTEYSVEILFDNLSNDEAYLKEKELIELYGRVDLGNGTLVNKTSGGQHCDEKIFTDEHKRNISIGRLGITFTDSHIDNLSKSHIGKDPWNKGKKLSKSHTDKLSKSIKKYYDELTPQEKKEKCTTYGMLNKNHKDSSKEKIRKSLIGRTREKTKCPHCGKEGGPGGFHRYHFNNCKNITNG
jgi:hypothetical protein